MAGPIQPRKPRPPGARKSGKREAPSAPPSHIRHGTYRGTDGTELFYSIEGQGKPLVFCYGLVCSSLHWTYQIDHFRHPYQAIWFDYRGHQNSAAPTDMETLTLSTLVDDLELLFQELQLDNAVLLGHSMGVNVVLEFFHRYPKRVAGMVLANGTPTRPLETLFNMNAFQAAFKLLKRAYDRSPELVSRLWKLQKGNKLAHALIGLGGFNPFLTAKEDIARYVDQVSEMDPRILLHLIEDYERFDATSWLHTIDVPTLILAGERDKIVPIEQQELMHQLIPGSEYEVIHHGSHCPQMDLPEMINERIQRFLDKMGY